jgi:hypothetical protein
MNHLNLSILLLKFYLEVIVNFIENVIFFFKNINYAFLIKLLILSMR